MIAAFILSRVACLSVGIKSVAEVQLDERKAIKKRPLMQNYQQVGKPPLSTTRKVAAISVSLISITAIALSTMYAVKSYLQPFEMNNVELGTQKTLDYKTTQRADEFLANGGSIEQIKEEDSKAIEFLNLRRNDIYDYLSPNNFDFAVGKIQSLNLMERIKAVLESISKIYGTYVDLVLDIYSFLKIYSPSGAIFFEKHLPILQNNSTYFTYGRSTFKTDPGGQNMHEIPDKHNYEKPNKLQEEKSNDEKPNKLQEENPNFDENPSVELLKVTGTKIFVLEDKIPSDIIRNNESIIHPVKTLNELQQEYQNCSDRKLVIYDYKYTEQGHNFEPIGLMVTTGKILCIKDKLSKRLQEETDVKNIADNLLDQCVFAYQNIIFKNLEKELFFGFRTYDINSLQAVTGLKPENFLTLGNCSVLGDRVTYDKNCCLILMDNINTVLQVVNSSGDIIKSTCIKNYSNKTKKSYYSYKILNFLDSNAKVFNNLGLLEYLNKKSLVRVGPWCLEDKLPKSLKVVSLPDIRERTDIKIYSKERGYSLVPGSHYFFRDFFRHIVSFDSMENIDELCHFNLIDEDGNVREMQMIVIMNGQALILDKYIINSSIKNIFELAKKCNVPILFHTEKDGEKEFPVINFEGLFFACRNCQTNELKLIPIFDESEKHIKLLYISNKRLREQLFGDSELQFHGTNYGKYDESVFGLVEHCHKFLLGVDGFVSSNVKDEKIDKDFIEKIDENFSVRTSGFFEKGRKTNYLKNSLSGEMVRFLLLNRSTIISVDDYTYFTFNSEG